MNTFTDLCSHDPDRPGLWRPAIFRDAGGEWYIATDGRALLALRDKPAVAEWGDNPPECLRIVAPALALPTLATSTVADLRRQVGGYTPTECPRCNGRGNHPCTCKCGNSHDRPCGTCDGTGTTRPAPILCCGVPVDRLLLAALLAAAPEGRCELAVAKATPRMLYLRGERWIGVTAEVREPIPEGEIRVEETERDAGKKVTP